MRSLLSRSLLAAILVLAPMATGARAFLGHRRTETVYVAPTQSVVALPTTEVVSSSYLLPSSYYVPTVYGTAYSPLTPTYYLSPTSAYVVPSYRETSYYVPRRFLGRPIVSTTRSYYPTLLTTAWDYPLVTTAYPLSSDCDAAAPIGPVGAPVRSAPARTPSNGGAGERRPSGVLDSVPANEPGLSAGGAGGQGTGEPATGAGDATNTQTTPPRPTPDPGAPPTTPAPPAGPVPPVDEIPKTSGAGQPGGPTSDTTVPQGSGARYDVRKPRSTDADVRPVSLTRSILEGKVISADSGQPEEGVRVTIIDHRGRFDDRTATTDALGRYAVNLPEGDWTVRVEMPSRKTYPVSEITVGGGRITDTSGRAVASLTIKR